MKNQAFVLVDDDEKERKLCTIIRGRTNDALTYEQLKYILLSLKPDIQYEISVFTDPLEFCEAMTLDDSNGCVARGRVVFGQALFWRKRENRFYPGQLFCEQEPAAVLIAHFSKEEQSCLVHSLLIYVPPLLYKRGEHK